MKPTEIGTCGEAAVCRYLEERGYTIRDRNFRIRGGEIDIVAVCGEALCIVEVKTRRIGTMESGVEAVDRRKQQRLIRACYRYIEKRGIDESQWNIRYDIAVVNMWQGRIIDIDYLENAFDESDYSIDEISDGGFSW